MVHFEVGVLHELSSTDDPVSEVEAKRMSTSISVQSHAQQDANRGVQSITVWEIHRRASKTT